MKLTVLGPGCWGLTIAKLLNDNFENICVWGRKEDITPMLENETGRENRREWREGSGCGRRGEGREESSSTEKNSHSESISKGRTQSNNPSKSRPKTHNHSKEGDLRGSLEARNLETSKLNNKNSDR